MERVIFSHQGVTVSYSHFSVNNKTYPIKDITYVEGRMLKPQWMLGRTFIFGGLPFLFGDSDLLILGLALMLIGLLLWKAAKERYAVVVHTPAGEYQPLIRNDSQDIANVLSALNVAIAMKAAAR